MPSPLVLAIDQGTTNTKALLFEPQGRILARASVPNIVRYPGEGWAEQSGEDLWRGVAEAIASVLRDRGGADGIAALAISNQRESVLVWDAVTGEPIGPCILWQCRRTISDCERLRAEGHGERIEAKTGLGLDPLFPASKIAWLLDSVPGARERAGRGELRAGTVDSWLLWRLTGGTVHATDHSNASRTQLFDTDRLCWDETLCALFAVPPSLLASVHPSNALFARTVENASSLPAGLPVHAMIGDSHAALYGHGVREPGTVKATYGTGTSLMTLTAGKRRSRHGISSTIAWSTEAGVVHALEGNISVSGQTAAFMAQLLGLPDVAALARLAGEVEDSAGVVFVPALVGLGAPHWNSEARGTLTGMTPGTRPAHLARAAFEAIALQITDVFEAIEADLGPLNALSADGGGVSNTALMQFQADILGRTVCVGAVAELSAWGAAALAFEGLGVAPATIAPARGYEPRMTAALRNRHRLRWQAAIRQTITS